MPQDETDEQQPVAVASAAPSAPPLALCVPATAAVAEDGTGSMVAVDAVALPVVRPAKIHEFDPYRATSAPDGVTLSTDGAKGADSVNGRNGLNAKIQGGNGAPGQGATPAVRGDAAGRIDLELRYTGEVSLARQRPCRMTATMAASVGGSASRREEVLELGEFPNISVSSAGGAGGRGGRGGAGGHGARGRRGKNATRHRSGENGGNGGNGGDGGPGTSGRPGGHGGVIHIAIPENDRFLLMAVAGLDNPEPLVKGGSGGRRGGHGRGGQGGAGGKGGSSYSYTDSDGDRHTNYGGRNGHRGHNGWTPDRPLEDGAHGKDGRVVIQQTSGSTTTMYDKRYDLRSGGHAMGSNNEMVEPHCFQFGDTAFVRQIEVHNVGGMPSPPEKVVFSLFEQHETDDTNYIVPLNLKKAVFPYGSATIPENGKKMATGSLEYLVNLPRDEPIANDDFEPIVRRMNLRLRATQLGPQENGSDSRFHRDYPSFDTNGTPVTFRYPIENTEGFEGITSIRSGETMKVNLTLSNFSVQDIGSASANSRKLSLQLYSDADLDLTMQGEDCVNLNWANEDANSLWRGHPVDVPLVKANSSLDVKGTLRLSNQILPYSRVAVHANILLEKLVSPLDAAGATREKPFSLVQRRKLTVVSEPSCAFRQDCNVVLVTSVSTTRADYLFYKQLIVDRLGLQVDTFAVSLYGSLSPSFVVMPGRDLRTYFREKLIIVLDRDFNPLDDGVDRMAPSAMLPNGCMEQASGFHPSTKWVLVDSSKQSIEGLLVAHYTAPADDATTFDSKGEFYKAMKERLKNELSAGELDRAIREDVIQWKAGGLRGRHGKAAQNEVAAWLRKKDPLRQHVVEWSGSAKEGSVIVRRGFCSTMNSAFVVQDGTAPSVQFAVAQALPPKLGIKAFARAMRHSAEDGLCRAFRDAFTSNFLREVENFLLGDLMKSRLSQDVLIQDFFPSLARMANNRDIADLIAQKGSEAFVKGELSSLVAQLRCVAKSKDLRPWWNPLSSKFKLKDKLMQAVDEIESSWEAALDSELIESRMAEIKDSVRSHIKNTRKKHRVKVHDRWRKGLRWKFSPKGAAGGVGVVPLVEMGDLYQNPPDPKKFSHRKALARVPEHTECEQFRKRAQQRMVMSGALLESIVATRQREVLDSADPDVDLTS